MVNERFSKRARRMGFSMEKLLERRRHKVEIEEFLSFRRSFTLDEPFY